MKRHILLCGARGVGKSTLIHRLLRDSDLRPGGFCTKLDRNPGETMHPIYIYPASVPMDKRIRSEENLIGRCDSHNHDTRLQVFDTLGVAYLQDTADCDAVVMDELGFMESKAESFCAAVFTALDGDLPVLAAVKDRADVDFLNRVRAHSAAQVVTITEKNREELYAQLLPIVKSWKK